MLNNRKITRTRSQTKVTKTTDDLLTMRVLNSLPLFSTAMGFYNSAKESNAYLKKGIDYAEGSLMSFSAPFVNRYTKLDHYVSDRLDLLEETYKYDGLTAAVARGSFMGLQVAALPLGYTANLARKATSKAMNLASPVVDRVYNAADSIVDGLLPASETEGDLSKNPINRIRHRANMRSLRAIPANTLRFSARTAQNLSYMGLDFFTSTFLLQALFGQIERTLHLLARFERLAFITSPLLDLWNNSNIANLPITQQSTLLLNNFLFLVWERSDFIQSFLTEKKLPKSAKLVKQLTTDLKRFTGYFGLGQKRSISAAPAAIKSAPTASSASASAPAKKFRTKLFPMKQARVQLQQFSKNPVAKPFAGDQRMPTFFDGESPLDRVEQRDNSRTPALLGVSAPKPVESKKKSHFTPDLQAAYLRNLLSVKVCPATPNNSPANWITASRAGSIVSIADESEQPATAEVELYHSSDSVKADAKASESDAKSASESGEWEPAKKPIHVEQQSQMQDHKLEKDVIPDIVLNQNNPFAALGQAAL